MSRRNKKILIIGGSGLLGFHCSEELSDDFEILATFNSTKLPTKNKKFLYFNFFSDSIYNIVKKFKPHVIINASGFVTVDGCEEDPKKAIELNSVLIKEIVNSLKSLNLNNCHLIQISTAAVYGNSDDPRPWKETDLTYPISVYSHTKLLGEYLSSEHQGPVTIIRSDFYGINPYSEKSLLWWIVKNAKNEIPMAGWENIHFSPISARYLSATIGEIIKNKITGVYNVGCLNDCNKYSFVNAVCKSLSLKAKVKRTKLVNDSLRPNYTITDSSKIFNKIALGKTWEEDLADYMNNLPPFP